MGGPVMEENRGARRRARSGLRARSRGRARGPRPCVGGPVMEENRGARSRGARSRPCFRSSGRRGRNRIRGARRRTRRRSRPCGWSAKKRSKRRMIDFVSVRTIKGRSIDHADAHQQPRVLRNGRIMMRHSGAHRPLKSPSPILLPGGGGRSPAEADRSADGPRAAEDDLRADSAAVHPEAEARAGRALAEVHASDRPDWRDVLAVARSPSHKHLFGRCRASSILFVCHGIKRLQGICDF